MSLCISLYSPASLAAEESQEVVVSEEYAKANYRYGESEKITVVATDYETITVTPDGQLPGGEKFESGGGFYVYRDKGPVMSFSFAATWGRFSFGVSIGLASTEKVGGRFVEAPDNIHFFKVLIDKTMKLERHKVDVYQYGVYQYTYYTNIAILHQANYRCIPVN